MKKSIIKSLIIPCLVTMFFIGCLGGGGGGGKSVPVSSLVSWSSVTPPTKLNVDGISYDASYTAPGPGFSVTSITDHGVTTTSSVSLTYRNDGTIERISIKTPNTSVVWNESTGDLIDDTMEVVGLANITGSNIGIAANPIHPNIGWEYQTFGIWQTGRGTGSGTLGAITMGAPTAGNAIPLVDNVTFKGVASGMYLNAAGTSDYITAGDLTADVDFFNRSIELSTTGTMKIETSTLITSDAANLDMSGTLLYNAGVNSFTGDVSATSLSGTSTGQFYGPNAEELGGVFSLSGDGMESYSGGYGAKRP